MESLSAPHPIKRPGLIAVAFMIGAFIGLFSETALNLAFTNIMEQFSIRPSTVQWLTTGYLLVLGILVPVSALLLQWFTTRQLFSASLLFSIIGTLLAALSTNFTFLLIARLIQAAGTALLLPLMMNVILVIFPIHRRGTIMGLMGLVIMSAPAFGPTISGIIVEKWGWEFIFWMCLPLLAATFLFGLKNMQNVSTITKPRIDIVSIILSTFGFGGVVYGFSNAGEHAFTDMAVAVPLLTGIVALILFAWRQSRMDKPMLDLRVFKYPMFTIGVGISFLGMMLILATSILLPMYLKGGLLLTAAAAGFALLPGGLVNGIMSPICGKLFDAYGPKALVTIGFILAAVASFLFTTITPETSTLFVILIHSIMFIGVAMIMMPAQTNGLNQLPAANYPDGSAVMNTLSQVAGAIGTTLAITLMTAGESNYMNSSPADESPAAMLTAGIEFAFIFITALAVIGLIISFFIKRVAVQARK